MNRRFFRLASSALLVTACLIAGCGGSAARRGTTGPTATATEPAIVDLTNPAAPVPPEQFLKPNEALIAPGDQIELRLLGYKDFSGMWYVSPDGRLNLSLVGSVLVAGKTVDQVDRELTEAYGAYLRNLDLSVNVNNRAPRLVYVLGEVFHAGSFQFQPGTRVLQALALGGGMRETARENNVVLMRRSPEGVDHVYRFDFGKIHDTLAPADVYLQPGDVVFVPKSRFKTFTEFASGLLDVLSRASTTAITSEEVLGIRQRALAITQ